MNSRYHLKWSEPFQALSHVQGMMQNLNTLQRGSIGHVGNLQYTSDCYLFVYFWHRTCKKTMALLLLCLCVIIGDLLATLITFRLEQTHCFVVSLCVCVCWCLFSIFHAFGLKHGIEPSLKHVIQGISRFHLHLGASVEIQRVLPSHCCLCYPASQTTLLLTRHFFIFGMFHKHEQTSYPPWN